MGGSNANSSIRSGIEAVPNWTPLLRSWFRCFLRLGYKDLAPTEPFSIRQPPDQAKILSPRRAFSSPVRAIPNNQTPFRPFARSPIRRFAVSQNLRADR
jgi:hypothetical protein